MPPADRPSPLANPSTPPPERLEGAIERVTFHSEESGFCVLRVKVRGRQELVTVIGNAASITPGEHMEAIGTWVNDPQHGRQFRADQLRLIPPSTLEGIERYLGSGLVRGIGPHFAKTLVAAFGEAVFEVIAATISVYTTIRVSRVVQAAEQSRRKATVKALGFLWVSPTPDDALSGTSGLYRPGLGGVKAMGARIHGHRSKSQGAEGPILDRRGTQCAFW